MRKKKVKEKEYESKNRSRSKKSDISYDSEPVAMVNASESYDLKADLDDLTANLDECLAPTHASASMSLSIDRCIAPESMSLSIDNDAQILTTSDKDEDSSAGAEDEEKKEEEPEERKKEEKKEKKEEKITIKKSTTPLPVHKDWKTAIVSSQQFDGCWDDKAIQTILQAKANEAMSQNPQSDQKLWATALAIALLEGKCTDSKTSWEIVANKGRMAMSKIFYGKEKKGKDEIQEQVNQMIVKAKEILSDMGIF